MLFTEEGMINDLPKKIKYDELDDCYKPSNEIKFLQDYRYTILTWSADSYYLIDLKEEKYYFFHSFFNCKQGFEYAVCEISKLQTIKPPHRLIYALEFKFSKSSRITYIFCYAFVILYVWICLIRLRISLYERMTDPSFVNAMLRETYSRLNIFIYDILRLLFKSIQFWYTSFVYYKIFFIWLC